MAQTADDRLSQRSAVDVAKAAGHLQHPCEGCGEYALTTNGEVRECHACGAVTSN